ncbi:MAG: FliM/FliN family flagellar motor C-terminal domain-containing protein [bacterium]
MEKNKSDQFSIPTEGTVENSLDKSKQLLKEIVVPLSVQLGQTKISIKEIGQFKIGDIIELHKKESPVLVELWSQEKLLAMGELVNIEGELGVRVIDLVSFNLGEKE